jgi:3-deoxy-D-manno-octulosonic-acid transferase
VLAETEFWPNLLHGCFRRGIPVAVVNARISDRSWPRYWRLRGLWKPFLSQLTALLAQSATDAERLRALGCLPDRVTVSGNLKFDVRAAAESAATSLLRDRSAGLRIVVAGSTLAGEEEILLTAWPELLAANPALSLVLAPRHPERFAMVAALLDGTGLPWRKRTTFGDTELAPGEIVLLDSIGELASVYSLASVAFVGGSLVPSGGHNPLEPAQFGVPIVMGPSYQNFRAIVESLILRDAVFIVEPGSLGATLSYILSGGAGEAGTRARQVFEEQSGATARTVVALRKILGKQETE